MSRIRTEFRLLVLVAGMASATAPGQEMESFVSSKEGDRLAARPSVKFTTGDSRQPGVFHVDEAVTHQTIAGFGASFLEAGLICINSLPVKKQGKVFEALFDPVRGAGFSAMKTPLAGTDFMSAGPWYTYNDHLGDIAMKQFSIERDLGKNGLITYIKRARKFGSFVLQAPMDYPPDWMLFDVNKNQDVDPQYFDALALYYLRYLQEYQKHSVFIHYLSLFNEPGVYTKIPYHKIRDLLKNHVGPLLQRKGIRTKLMLSEAPVRGQVLANYPVVLDDPAARKFVAAIPYHGYDRKDFASIATLHRRYPDIPLWMTELCYAYLAGTLKTAKVPNYDFEDGDAWGQQIVSDLEAGASAWIYWNMVLDQNGGPWAVSPIHGNRDANIQHPVVIINRETKQVTYTGCYYYLAHFSKFVRPGAKRVAVQGEHEGVRCLAFKTPERTLVVQFLNSCREKTDVCLAHGNASVRLTLPAISITTCRWKSARP
ncbi:MAG: glycoside hydrolase family 30 protein [Verrucomicrobia bacterium]|nr:glycoside hydrolase family 30 protein [Verrucomicrobiota bacterium]